EAVGGRLAAVVLVADEPVVDVRLGERGDRVDALQHGAVGGAGGDGEGQLRRGVGRAWGRERGRRAARRGALVERQGRVGGDRRRVVDRGDGDAERGGAAGSRAVAQGEREAIAGGLAAVVLVADEAVVEVRLGERGRGVDAVQQRAVGGPGGDGEDHLRG